MYLEVIQSEGEERIKLKVAYCDILSDHLWIATFACLTYAVLVHAGKALVKTPKNSLRPIQIFWNLAISIFSAFGAYHSVSWLLKVTTVYGLQGSVCVRPPFIDTFNGSGDIWVGVYFVLSKVAEFSDTFFIVMLKRKLRFIHWYHHMMTCWVAWYSIAYGFGPGIWYAAVNFSVHTIMYFYFFLSGMMSENSFKFVSKVAGPLITSFQILQMVYLYLHIIIW